MGCFIAYTSDLKLQKKKESPSDVNNENNAPCKIVTVKRRKENWNPQQFGRSR